MSVPSSPFHYLLLKLSNKGMSFPFPPLKLPNKGMKEYFKIILFILFHSITFPPPKWSLTVPINQTHNTKHFYYTFFLCVISQAKSFFFLISFFFSILLQKVFILLFKGQGFLLFGILIFFVHKCIYIFMFKYRQN